jgi:tetratricopeptide (TPR) repeat protein
MKMGLRHAFLIAPLISTAVLLVQGAAPARAALEAVPFPPLSALEPAVARQIRSVEAELDAVLKSPAATDAALSETFGEIGQLFHAYELWHPAAASYRNARRLSPDEFRWIHLLSELEVRRGDLAQARQLHEAALALRPDDVPSLVGLGNVSMDLNRLQDAETSFWKALRLSPDSAAAHAGLGRLALLRRDYGKAAAEFEAALRLAPEANRLHYELAMACRGLGSRNDAARHLALAGTVGVRAADPLLDGVSTRRKGERAHLVRGRLAFVNGRMREAAEEFSAAVEAEPRSVAGLVGLGSALGTLGETDRALEVLRQALAIAPDSVAAHYNVGRLLAARGDTEAALREYDAVLRLAPQDEDAFRAKADLLARRSRR